MAWVQPPPDVRRLVEQHLGDGIWNDLEASWLKVAALDPQLQRTREEGGGLTQWYRSPQAVLTEYRRNPDAALYSQHGLGLAIDVTPSERYREQVIAAAKAAGFSVKTYTRNRHIHLSRLRDEQWARSPLQAALRARLSPLFRRPR